MSTLFDWAARWRIPHEALVELQRELGYLGGHVAEPGASESAVLAAVRLEAARAGRLGWRNNVGALQDERGRVVRYGLANDSKALNARIKSADLIGINPVLITPGHVGKVIGQFWSRECKAAGWRYTGTDREQAQARWIELIQSRGGDACFASGVGTIIDASDNK